MIIFFLKKFTRRNITIDSLNACIGEIRSATSSDWQVGETAKQSFKTYWSLKARSSLKIDQYDHPSQDSGRMSEWGCCPTVLPYKREHLTLHNGPKYCCWHIKIKHSLKIVFTQCFRRSVGPPDISGKNRVGQIKFRTTPDQNVR